jgi:hypothetical protein
VWSNRELSRFAHLFSGDIVNVSGWTDIDKEGRHYKDYFKNASSYTITNFESDKRGYQGGANEIFLDLTAQLPPNLHHRFDVVFNHTTLEHIFELTTAFSNLCQLSKDTVILVLPFLQQYHADYGDYWRLSPLAIKRLFELNDMELVYQSFNNHAMSSIYTFSIASRHPERWRKFFDWNFSCRDADWRGSEPFIGCRAIPNIRHRISKKLALWRIKR